MSIGHDHHEVPSSQVEKSSPPVGVSYLKSWLLFLVFASALGIVGEALFGMLAGSVIKSLGVSRQLLGVVGILGYVVMLPISYFSFKWSVNIYVVSPLVRKVD